MINQYVSRIGSMEKMEEYWNKSATQIRETLRENAREGLTVQRMQQKLVGEVKITPLRCVAITKVCLRIVSLIFLHR